MSYLYKFSNLNIDKLACLASNKIWFSNFRDFNDPFEGKVNIVQKKHAIKKINKAIEKIFEIYPRHDVSLDDIIEPGKRATKGEIDDRLSMLLDHLYYELDFIQDLSACCFMGGGEDVVTNKYMWSHYADGLRGYCIKFDREHLIKSFKKENSDSFVGSVNVNYCERSPFLDPVDFYCNIDDIYPIDFPMEFYAPKIQVYRALATKSKYWALENEVRVLSLNRGLLSYDANSIVEIIIGEKMNQEQQELIKMVVSSIRKKITIKKASIRSGEYSIDVSVNV